MRREVVPRHDLFELFKFKFKQIRRADSVDTVD